MIRRLILLLAVCLATPALAGGFAPLQWQAPPLDNPITIQLGDGPTSTWLDKSKDYIIKLPPTVKAGGVTLSGGHNIVMIGGEIAPKADDPQHRAIYIYAATGTVHIEGVKISNPTGAMFDGIAINAPLAIVHVQRVWIGTIYGWYAKWHGDLIQPWGGVLALGISDFTGITAYQGYQFSGMTGPVGSVDIRRSNVRSSGTQIWSSGKNGGNGGYLFWGECNATYSLHLEDAYLKPRAVRGPSLAVYPDRGSKCPATVATDGKRVSMVKPTTTGDWIIGGPKGGDYAPAASVGLNYQR